MEILTREQRTARIQELRKELEELQKQEAAEYGVDRDAVIQECREMKQQGILQSKIIAHYRAMMGCGLREAYDAVVNM